MNKTDAIGTESIPRLLLDFSVPAMVGMMINALYNVVDRIFIGNHPSLGAAGLAGITIGFPIMTFLISVATLFGIGGATLFSLRLGDGNAADAGAALGNAFLMLLTAGIILTALGHIFMIPILTLFGADAVTLPYAASYMRIIFCGAVFQIVSMGMNHFLRADGHPRLAMITMLVAGGSNIAMDALFIFCLHWGMMGAALATILAQFIAMIWILSYFLSPKCLHRLTLHHMKPKLTIITRIVSLGIPNFCIQLVNSLLGTVLNKSLLQYGGSLAVSAMGIVNSIQTILLMPIVGLNQAVQTIVSYNFGAKNDARVKATEKLAIIAAVTIGTGGLLLIRLFSRQLIAVFNQDPALVELGSFALRTWFMLLPVIGFQMLASSYFQAIGRSVTATFLTLVRQMLLLIPAILIFPSFMGIHGVLYAAPFSDFLAAVITGTCFAVSMQGEDSRKRHLHRLLSDKKGSISTEE